MVAEPLAEPRSTCVPPMLERTCCLSRRSTRWCTSAPAPGTVEHGSTRQEIGAGDAELARGASAQHEAPPRLVGIVEVLDRVEDGGYVLRLVDNDDGRRLCAGQRPAPLDETVRIPQILCTLPGTGGVEPDRRLGEELPQQRRLSRLPGPEDEVDVRGAETLAPRRLGPATKRHVAFIFARRL